MLVPIKEFEEHEFKCRCGHIDCDYGYADMDEKFLSKLFTARKKSKSGYALTSAVRCPRHPEALKNPTSSHNAVRSRGLKSKAVDIRAPNSRVRFHVEKSLLDAGFVRLGFNENLRFIHVDSDENKDQEVIFSY